MAMLAVAVPLKDLHAKKITYWDHFREPVKKKTTSGYDLDVNVLAAGPMNDEIKDQTPFGFGFLLGFHYRKDFFRAGLELGAILYPGMEHGEDSEETKDTEHFISFPLYCDMGFDIKLHRVFSLVPFISLGVSFDFLRYTEYEDADPRNDGTTRDYKTLHLAERVGVGLWFHINVFYSIQVNAAYAPLIEFGDSVNVLHVFQLTVGFTRRL